VSEHIDIDRFFQFTTPEVRAFLFVIKEARERGNVVPAIFWMERELSRELFKRTGEQGREATK
jgi:hypothetical protein